MKNICYAVLYYAMLLGYMPCHHFPQIRSTTHYAHCADWSFRSSCIWSYLYPANISVQTHSIRITINMSTDPPPPRFPLMNFNLGNGCVSAFHHHMRCFRSMLASMVSRATTHVLVPVVAPSDLFAFVLVIVAIV